MANWVLRSVGGLTINSPFALYSRLKLFTDRHHPPTIPNPETR